MPQTTRRSNRRPWDWDDFSVLDRICDDDSSAPASRSDFKHRRVWPTIARSMKEAARKLSWRSPAAYARPAADCSKAVQDACIAIRLGCLNEAGAILGSVGNRGRRDAAWLNLRGVVYEARGDWRRAHRFYGKAMRADRRFAPAEQNMRRWFELFTFGHTRWPVALGDEMERMS